jgi:hypothetical protein
VSSPTPDSTFDDQGVAATAGTLTAGTGGGSGRLRQIGGSGQLRQIGGLERFGSGRPWIASPDDQGAFSYRVGSVFIHYACLR